MARMVANDTCYVNDRIYKKGDEFEYDGPSGKAFHPVDAKAYDGPSIERQLDAQLSGVGETAKKEDDPATKTKEAADKKPK